MTTNEERARLGVIARQVRAMGYPSVAVDADTLLGLLRDLEAAEGAVQRLRPHLEGLIEAARNVEQKDFAVESMKHFAAIDAVLAADAEVERLKGQALRHGHVRPAITRGPLVLPDKYYEDEE